jgi:hypothetical protein
LREGCLEGFFGQPNQSVAIRRELGGLGKRFYAVEHICNLFALIGSKTVS